MKNFPEVPDNAVVYAIGYVRVSDRQQEEQGHSMESQ